VEKGVVESNANMARDTSDSYNNPFFLRKSVQELNGKPHASIARDVQLFQ
jgi:hypothetical protein